MLDVSQMREKLGSVDLTDQQVETMRDSMYAMVENIIDNYYANIRTICKKHSSIAGSHQKNKKMKGTGSIARNIAVADMRKEKDTK